MFTQKLKLAVKSNKNWSNLPKNVKINSRFEFPRQLNMEPFSAKGLDRREKISYVQARMEETLELVRSHLDASGFGKSAGRRVVLTGGASQLEGLRDLSELVLDKQVRLGRPKMIRGLPESVSGPAFSTAAGLLRYGLREHVTKPDYAAMQAAKNKISFGRIGQWLKENF